jgi:hypothetical protein
MPVLRRVIVLREMNPVRRVAEYLFPVVAVLQVEVLPEGRLPAKLRLISGKRVVVLSLNQRKSIPNRNLKSIWDKIVAICLVLCLNN